MPLPPLLLKLGHPEGGGLVAGALEAGALDVLGGRVGAVQFGAVYVYVPSQALDPAVGK